MNQLKQQLDKLYHNIDAQRFIQNDPIQIPHSFNQKEDIEISGFLTCIIAWGNRKQIITNAYRIIQLMEFQPHEYILRHKNADLKIFRNFKHRTITGTDIANLCSALKFIYSDCGGLENIFTLSYLTHRDIFFSLQNAYNTFAKLIKNTHTIRQIPDVSKKSAAKRLNLFLRWMVRNDFIDFGLWKKINKADLYIPFDTHVLFAAKNLKLLNRNQTDWKSVYELTHQLKTLDPTDPIKYDLALFEYSTSQKLVTHA
ncbi:MAG: TIGR02757 family protein [Bacteroidales bacterium]|nr:TIGR02757 family protein [Bacteroidales bacterium]